MKKIYSLIDSEKLLHIILRKDDVINERENIIPVNNFLQCATIKMNHGKTFKPHKHFWKQRNENYITQESWVVIQGQVKCILYDLDDTIISEEILNPGDASFTIEGGHNYLILSDDTIVYEYKTGPYEGVELDKKFI